MIVCSVPALYCHNEAMAIIQVRGSGGLDLREVRSILKRESAGSSNVQIWTVKEKGDKNDSKSLWPNQLKSGVIN